MTQKNGKKNEKEVATIKSYLKGLIAVLAP